MVLQIKEDDQGTREMAREAFIAADANFMELTARVGNSK
jgi:hypothetical protein